MEGMSSEPIDVVDEAFPREEMDALYAALRLRPRMPASLLYIPAEDFAALEREEPGTVAALERYAPRALVRLLPRLVAKVRALRPSTAPLVGYEVFLSAHASEQHAQHAGLHVDANEPDWDTARVAWGSVLHVGPESVLEGGGTSFYPSLPVPPNVLARCFEPNSYESLAALSDAWVTVARKVGRLVAFDGRLPHFAERCRALPTSPRIALIVTAWETVPRFASPEPHVFSRLEPEEYVALTESPEEHLALVRDYARVAGEVGAERLAAIARAFDKVAAI